MAVAESRLEENEAPGVLFVCLPCVLVECGLRGLSMSAVRLDLSAVEKLGFLTTHRIDVATSQRALSLFLLRATSSLSLFKNQFEQAVTRDGRRGPTPRRSTRHRCCRGAAPEAHTHTPVEDTQKHTTPQARENPGSLIFIPTHPPWSWDQPDKSTLAPKGD